MCIAGYIFACFDRKSTARKRHASLICVMQVLLTLQQPFCVKNKVCIFLLVGRQAGGLFLDIPAI